MNPASAIIAVLATGPAYSGEWFCHSPLMPSDPPRSSLEFRLTLSDAGQFEAEGRRVDRGFGWSGAYTRFDDQIALIGALSSSTGSQEARALSQTVEPNVMILSMQDALKQPVMIRCMRHDLR